MGAASRQIRRSEGAGCDHADRAIERSVLFREVGEVRLTAKVQSEPRSWDLMNSVSNLGPSGLRARVRLGGAGDVVAGLSVQGAQFFLATEAPAYGTRSPAGAGFTTVRIELFVDDPVAVHRQDLAAGAIGKDPVREHTHTTAGPSP